MSAHATKVPRLESLLAALLQQGTWLASVLTVAGLALALLEKSSVLRIPPALSLRIVTLGIACFILLPVSRVILTLIVFLRRRDYGFAAIAAIVLLIILIGFVVGIRMAPPEHARTLLCMRPAPFLLSFEWPDSVSSTFSQIPAFLDRPPRIPLAS